MSHDKEIKVLDNKCWIFYLLWCEVIFCQLSFVTKEIDFEIALQDDI